jgi:phage terminase large subunit-like protein
MTSQKTTTASPDRTRAYADAVLAGAIVAGPHVRNACRRHLDDLKRGDIAFDPAAADRAFGFFETKLKLSEGQFEDKPFELAPAQAFIIGSLFGWKRLDGTRRFRRAYIEQGKGNGKSPLAGGTGLYGLTYDGEAGAEIYSAGATKDQAAILFRDAVKMVDKSPSLSSRLKSSGGPGREFNIAYLKNSSFFRPVSRETKKTGSGPRPHFALVDELHEHADGGIIEILERGFKFRRQPLLLMITNSGSDRTSVCWAEHEHAVQVAAGNKTAKDDDAHYLGERLDDTTFSYVCALDPEDDPLTQPECWIKANPLLNVTITEEYLAGVVAQAKALPSKLNGILRLHFCRWTDAETAWMTRERLEPCLADFDPAEHRGKKIWLSCDLSQNKDITALAAAVQTGEIEVEAVRDGHIQKVMKPTFDVWVEAWTPGDTIDARTLADKQPYRQWADEGYLHAPKGQSIRFDHVAQAVAEYAHDYDVQFLAYDRYAFKRGFEPECEKLGLSVEFVEHPQGGTKKGHPTESMKEAAKDVGTQAEGLWMPGSVRETEDAILEGRVRIRRNPAVVTAIMSAVTDEDRWGNRWLAKERSVNKIDCAVAICMAVGSASIILPQNESVFDVLARSGQSPAEDMQKHGDLQQTDDFDEEEFA